MDLSRPEREEQMHRLFDNVDPVEIPWMVQQQEASANVSKEQESSDLLVQLEEAMVQADFDQFCSVWRNANRITHHVFALQHGKSMANYFGVNYLPALLSS